MDADAYTFTPEDFAKHHPNGGIVFEVEGPTSVFGLSKIELMELPPMK